MRKSVWAILLVCCVINVQAQNVEVGIKTKKDDPKMEWWKDAKFGMFIHWGVYSVPAGKWGEKTNYGEWIMNSAKIPVNEYAQLTKKFNPTQFNAEEWVKVAKAAGQKYMVITSKHHDGFAMFKSTASDFNIVDATPFKRDVLKELAEACRKYDMKLGFYYSQAQDWHHKGGGVYGSNWDSSHVGDMKKYVDDIVVPQVREILTNYGDVAVLWWDTPVGITKEMAQEIANELKPYPNLITNNRLGGGVGGDLETPEQFIPATGFPGKNWEVCMTMNGHWGYNAYDENWKSTKELLMKLVDIVSKGGNFLLNVGPTSEGIIPQVCQQNLKEMGEWLKLNGDAVYGTKGSPFPFLSWGRATRKGQTLYLHVFDWPKDGQLDVPLGNKITKAYLLADRKKNLLVTQSKGKSTIMLPAYAPDKVASVVAIEFVGEPIVSPPPAANKLVTVSSKDSASNATYLTDGDPKTKWAAAKGEKNATLEIDLGAAYNINALALVEPWHPWSGVKQQHTLQYFDGKDWKEVISSTSEGTGSTETFKQIKSQKFRLLLKNEKFPPSLGEWILYRAD